MFFDSVVTSLRPCLPVSLPASALPYALSAPLPFQEVWKIELIFDQRAQVSPKWQRFFLHGAKSGSRTMNKRYTITGRCHLGI